MSSLEHSRPSDGDAVQLGTELGDRGQNQAGLLAKIHQEHAAVQAALHDAIKHAVQCGKHLLSLYKHVRYRQKEKWLKENVRFAPRTARLYMQLARLDEPTRQRVAKMPLREVARFLRKFEKGDCDLSTTDDRSNQEHYTKKIYIKRAERALGGGIILDPASSAKANTTVQAERFYDKSDNSLERRWNARRLFLNPPFDMLPQFFEKLVREIVAGRVESAIAILPLSFNTDKKWFQDVMAACSAICFVNHRPKFDNAPWPSQFTIMFVYFGSEPEVFEREFKEIGAIMFGPSTRRA